MLSIHFWLKTKGSFKYCSTLVNFNSPAWAVKYRQKAKHMGQSDMCSGQGCSLLDLNTLRIFISVVYLSVLNQWKLLYNMLWTENQPLLLPRRAI